MPSSEIVLEEGFKPGYIGRMIQMQGEYYDVAWERPGVSFEVMMARQMCDFHDQYLPGTDLLITAHVDGIMAGNIAVLGSQNERPGARLRWFHVDPACQNRGIGRILLIRAIEFCRQAGFKSVWLWTMEGLDAARHLYDSLGFKQIADFSSGLPFLGVTMELLLE
ncbi:L-amino acid N-acyltransferase YncA [Dehalogenimonas formicexedens]|uniref:L-amino acid N-acyltransferase YncA n=1 Tax=Dehalogenimonas formicexedens TaxID=1839801 RepID=A0A1P8F804_9CHLR|nr:GNAT family N-acetyltransferase [Dehalogenimonas formicexedens]APV44578.1 L-amino acid N-acyltransferase YncA [Dehalogenimonas formicexedens]